MWIAGCVMSALGCAASQPATRASNMSQPAPVAAPGELPMRRPDDVRSSAARMRGLGVLEPVHAAKPRVEARSSQPTAAGPRTPRPIQVAPDSVRERYAVRDGQVLLPSGLIIHGVPKTVSVRSVREQGGGDVWEIVDARGERLALLKAESLSRSLVPRGASLNELAGARSVGPRSDWGAPHVKVVSESVLSENYVYTIERRAKGTEWIASGLEFSAHDARGRAE
jgi:hypothetical protein